MGSRADTYTPGARVSTRKSTLRLSEREYEKITGTIASVRRHRQRIEDGIEDSTESDARDIRRKRPGNDRNEPSFIAETSFVRAPLNSRVDVHVSGASSSSKSKGKGKEREESLAGLPLEIQEALILEDLLYVLMGIEGTYITLPPDYSIDEDDPLQGIHYVVSTTLDPSLRDLVERILPLGTYYTAISSFVEARSHLDHGLVNHALCASIRSMLKDYLTLLTQLEHAFTSSPTFSLQKLWFYVHPTTHTLSLLYTLITDLATAAASPDGDGASSSSSSSSEDEDDALGLGGAKLKAVLSEIAGTADSGIAVKGGEVLAVLHDRLEHTAGDPAARTLYGTLLRDAGRPYVGMLRTWVSSGKLSDPYDEFCVKESAFIDRGTLEVDYTDEYWERRYTLRDGSTLAAPSRRQAGVPPPRAGSGRLPGGACVPPLLEAWKHKVLLAGKYLNVIRECGIGIGREGLGGETEGGADGDLSMDDERLYKFIEAAYTHANRTLLQLLLRDQYLLPRLRSLKRFFFLSQSSFLTHFLDLAHSELRKSARSASLVKLQSLLELSLNTGGEGGKGEGENASFRDDVRVSIAGSGLYEWLLKVVSVTGVVPGGGEEGADGGGIDAAHQEDHRREREKDDKKQILAIDALALDYNVKFPLSLVVSRKTILRYQLIFRFLLHLKHVEQSLAAMWIEQKTLPWRKMPPSAPGADRPGGDFEAWRLRVFLLRARMLSFVQQILAFATFEVLEPNWRALEKKLEKVNTVDQLLKDHVDFLDTCLKECMLTSAKLLKAYSRLIVTCSTFALYAASFTKSANQALAAAESAEGDPAMEKRWDFLSKFERNFDHWFKVHLDCVQFYASSENVSLLPLVVRLSSIRKAT
ncbi:hypothetical protein PUNSTDRAFT_115910 [Punctularia strigosozonata HHB-11173 SS5]|uniref:uncharacterized protein n=1 Tax=Punctularia strigosozonata (strain HHB-11173) TaxID=741275 RepID=UPI0004417854|nr:uncharacterized protein PUNSTDRAFT_115910 [Punctularia strigosozonata HHB-11173 SS5]EIN05477.1 hypothetical protein PUNSTDRAFT_115910 [Punctularia strigosozonata HHB-11173 SS5]